MNSSGLEEHLPDEAATLLMGGRLALALNGEPGPFVITLSGALGSGKTTLVRGLLRALGAQGAIRSPSLPRLMRLISIKSSTIRARCPD